MDRVKSQAAVVSQLLFDPKTADAYKNVLILTGQIIKEVALLLWLGICSILVFVAWFGDLATSSGRKARMWWQAQQTDSSDAVDGNQAAAATGQALLGASQNGAYFLLDKAREQLGLDKIERPVKAEPPATKAPAAKTAAPAEKAAATKVTSVAKETSQPAATTVPKETTATTAPKETKEKE